jgi:nucleoside-diphosphate-sugar epimerase
MKKRDLPHMIYFSSICAAGLDLTPQPLKENQEPLLKENDFYGQYKLTVEEKLIEQSQGGGFPVTIIRPTIVYGPGTMTNAYALYKMIANRQLVLWNHGENIMRFCYIKNLINAVIAVSKNIPDQYRIFHVGDSEEITLKQYCDEVAQALGLQLVYKNYSKMLGRALGFLRFITNRFELTKSPATHFLYDTWTRSMNVDISLLKNTYPELEFVPMKKAVQETAEYYCRMGRV